MSNDAASMIGNSSTTMSIRRFCLVSAPALIASVVWAGEPVSGFDVRFKDRVILLAFTGDGHSPGSAVACRAVEPRLVEGVSLSSLPRRLR